MKPSNIPNECRTCLKQDVSFRSIFSMDERSDVMITYANIINISISSLLHISEEDGLSDKICSSCAQKVLEFYKFKSSIETNDLILKSRTTNLNVDITTVTNGVWVKQENLDWDDEVQKNNVNCDMTDNTKNPLEDTNKGAHYLIKEEPLELEHVKIEECNENNYGLYTTDNTRTLVESVDDDMMQEDGVSLNEGFNMSDCEDDFAAKKNLKSSNIYNHAYNKFIAWCEEKGEKNYSEKVLLAFFIELRDKMKWKSSTMWSHYSMIKSLLKDKNGVDISNYCNLRAFLKKQNVGYTPKKTRVFTKQQVEKFLIEAPDEFYLDLKIVLILGLCGSCRCEELVKMKLDDIKDFGSKVEIKILGNKPNQTRSFQVCGDIYLQIYRKYISLRPKDMTERRFFIKYNNGKCWRQVMGIHKIGNVPKEVAEYLKLPNYMEYTGHSIRRTSAVLTDWGFDITTFKQKGG